jgi:hypothetical protein
MITSELEVRIALQAVLVSVLALSGCWGCALVMLVILLPWKPILAVGGYLAQPVVDWRAQKACDRHEKGIAQIEQELDALLRAPRGTPRASTPAAAAVTGSLVKPSHPHSPHALESFKPIPAARTQLRDLPPTEQTLSATLAIPPAIRQHVRSLPQGVFSNMNLEVEQVKFNGDKAEACVKFQSPNVTELVIRQRYVLRKSGERWQVESRQPANGASKAQHHPLPVGRPPMHLV